jgi:hypothetical protein
MPKGSSYSLHFKTVFVIYFEHLNCCVNFIGDLLFVPSKLTLWEGTNCLYVNLINAKSLG